MGGARLIGLWRHYPDVVADLAGDFLQHVEAGTCDGAICEGGDEVDFTDDGPSSDINDDRSWLHRPKDVCVDEAAATAVGCGGAHHKIGVRRELVQRSSRKSPGGKGEEEMGRAFWRNVLIRLALCAS